MTSKRSKPESTLATNNISNLIATAIKLLQDRAENSNKFANLVLELNDVESLTLGMCIVGFVKTTVPGSLKEVPILVDSIKELPSLPSQLLSEARRAPTNSMQLCSLLFVIAALDGHGFVDNNTLLDLYDEFNVSDAMMSSFMNALMDGIKEDVESHPMLANGKHPALTDILGNITPLGESDPYSITDMYNKPLSFDVPIREYLADLDSIFEGVRGPSPDQLEPEVERIREFSAYFTRPKSKQQAKRIQNLMEQDQFAAALPICINLESRESSNPVAFYIHQQCLDCLSERHEPSNEAEMAELLQRAFGLARERPLVDIFLSMTHVLYMCGYFNASYVLANRLLQHFPIEFSLHVIAAFCAYQLLRPFEDDLTRAFLVNAPNLVKDVSKAWKNERFMPVDSLAAYEITEESLSALVAAKASTFRALFRDQQLPPGFVEMLGPEFPFERILGQAPE
jgi:hypothetical protein